VDATLSVQKRILERLKDMTPAQQLMAMYVLDHAELVAFMTAQQLADKLGQSDASVIRLARMIGYKGYSDMRRNLRQGLLGKVGARGLHQQGIGTDDGKLLGHLVDVESLIVKETARLNDAEQMTEITKKLISANRINVTGHGTSYPLAAYLAMNLNQCLGNTQVFNIGVGDLAERFRTAGPDEVFIGIGYVRYLPYTIEIMRLARARGAHVIAITDRPSSPLAEVAHQSLFVMREVSPSVWWSQTGTLFIANWLVMLVMAQDSKRVEQQLKRADEELERIGFWNPGSSSKKT